MPLPEGTLQGTILKGIGGFYYVEAADTVYECKARGIFRRHSQKPLAGDQVVIVPAEDGTATIDEILPRKNQLVRPPVANIDQLIITASTCDPVPNPLIIDKMTALAVHKNIQPVVVITKSDLDDGAWLKGIYDLAQIRCVLFSAVSGEGAGEMKELLRNRISAFSGNSGVGKSSLLNRLYGGLQLETGDISQKLGRGRHTTRQVELFKLEGGGYVADTPGFSTVDVERYELIRKEELPQCFPEFEPYLNQCKFTSCAHICEKGCAVLKAVEEGKISKSRHGSYCAMYQEVKDVKEWELKKARCVIIGSAPVDEAERRFIGTQVSPEDFLVCADGGYETARRLGLKPDLLIGDLDSCTEDFPPDIEAVRLPVHKDDTDMMYSLKECLGRGYRDFLLLGATGGRLDHTVANLCGLYYLAMHNARGVLADRQNETVLVINGRVGLQGEPGALVSVFPYGASYCTLSYEGLEYPLDHYRLYPYDPMGTSNRLISTAAKITVHEGPALIIMAKENEKVCTDSLLPRRME